MSNSGSSSVVTGVVAVNNRGSISNVTIKGDMIMSTDGANGTSQMVAGIAVRNYGTIQFVKVHGNITSMANGGFDTKAGAIAGYNYNIITDACYYGLTTGITIKANQIGGIAYENYGSIDRSYIGDNATLYGVDVKKDGTNIGRTVVLGGLVGLLKQNKEGQI